MFKVFMHTVARWGGRFFIAGLWLVMAALALETCERAREWAGTKLYENYFQAQNAKVYRMVSAEEAAAVPHTPPAALAKDAAPPRALQARATPPGLETESDPDLRAVAATARGEFTARIVPPRHLIASWGDPLIELSLEARLRDEPSYCDWSEVLSALPYLSAPKECEIRIQRGMTAFYAVEMRPAEEGVVELHARNITLEKSLLEQNDGNLPPDDSPWEVASYSYKKNWHTEGHMIRTNQFGFRDDDVVMPKPEGLFRIVCIGGSTTEEGNSNAETYPNLVEKRLQARFGADRVDVVNGGLCGLSTFTMLLRLPDYLALDPDLIVYYGPINDYQQVYFWYWLGRISGWRYTLTHSCFLRQYFPGIFLPSATELTTMLGNTTHRLLRAIHMKARDAGVDMAVCSMAYPYVSWTDFRAWCYLDVNMQYVWNGRGIINFRAYRRLVDLDNRLLRALCACEGMRYIPFAEEFHGGADEFFDICHMTRTGLEHKADVIAAHLADYVAGHLAAPAS